jgi:mannosyltransferase
MTFLVPFLVTLVVGAVGITRQAWRDEHSTWWAATIPLPDLGSLLSHVDIVLAPYYVFMRGWIFVFGDSVVALRLPSLLAMAAAAGLTAMVGERMFGAWVGVTAGCLFAVLPSVSRYAQEARPYAFAICFAVASVLAVLTRRWVFVAVFVALTGFAHLIALTVLLAHLPLLDRLSLRRWAVSAGLGVAPLVPLAILGASQTGQLYWIDAGWKNLATLPMALTRSAVVAGILAALGLLAVLTAFTRNVMALVVWAAAPPLLIFVAAPQFFFYRYLLFTLPAWVLLAAFGAAQAIRQRQRLATVALCATVLLLGARDQVGVRKSPLPGDQDYQAAAGYVGHHLTPGDEVYFDGYPDQRERFGFAYELRRRPVPQLCRALVSCTRVWLVSNRVVPPPDGFTVLDRQRFPGLEVQLLRRDG